MLGTLKILKIVFIYIYMIYIHLPNVFRSYQFPYRYTLYKVYKVYRISILLPLLRCRPQGLCLDRMVRMGLLFNQLRGGSTSPQSKSLKLSDSTWFNYSLDLFLRRIWRRKCFEHFFSEYVFGFKVLQPSANGGKLCSGNLSIVRGCQIQSCPVQAGEISKRDAGRDVTYVTCIIDTSEDNQRKELQWKISTDCVWCSNVVVSFQTVFFLQKTTAPLLCKMVGAGGQRLQVEFMAGMGHLCFL